MKQILIYILTAVAIWAKPVEMTSMTHWPYIRFLHDAVYLEVPTATDSLKNTAIVIARIEPSETSGKVRQIGGWKMDGSTGKMFDTGIPKSHELDYSGIINVIDEGSYSASLSGAIFSYNWTISSAQNQEATVESAKDRAYNVWESGGYVLMEYGPKAMLKERTDIITHSVIPEAWVEFLRSSAETMPTLANADVSRLQQAALSENPIIAKYALSKLVAQQSLDAALFLESIEGRNAFDEVVMVTALAQALEESEYHFEELSTALMQVIQNEDSYEKRVLYSMSKYLNYPTRSPNMRHYLPQGQLLNEISNIAVNSFNRNPTERPFSDFVSTMNITMFGGEEPNSNEPIAATEEIQEIAAPEQATEEPAEVIAVEPIKEPVEKSSNWWLWLVGLLVAFGGVLVIRRKN